MHSRIYQIGSQEFTQDTRVRLNDIIQGNSAWVDYTYELDAEQRTEAIKDLTLLFPKGMLTFNKKDETLTYNGGFKEWRQKYVAKIKEMAETIDENSSAHWYCGSVAELQRYILNPLNTCCLFVEGDDISAEQSRNLACCINDLQEGEKLYFGTICGYHW